jgi:hypothetical protein
MGLSLATQDMTARLPKVTKKICAFLTGFNSQSFCRMPSRQGYAWHARNVGACITALKHGGKHLNPTSLFPLMPKKVKRQARRNFLTGKLFFLTGKNFFLTGK